MGFLYCLLYAIALGIISFLLGRLLPKSWFHFDRAPFRAFGWEKDGRVYLKVGINRWIRNEWVFSDSRIEPLFVAVGKWNLALSGGWNSKGEFTVTWMNLNGPQRDTFAILPDRASPPKPPQ